MISVEPRAQLSDTAQSGHGAVAARVRAGRSQLQFSVVLCGRGGILCALLPITASLNRCVI